MTTTSESLKNILEKSGWTVTEETDENGARICRPAEETEEALIIAIIIANK